MNNQGPRQYPRQSKASPDAGKGGSEQVVILEQLQPMIDGLAESVALVGCDGTIVLTNHHWQREVKRLGSWDFGTGCDYSGALAAMVEAGDSRLKPILDAFRDISAGARQQFHCVYFGSGVFSGHDYKVRLSAFEFAQSKYVLIGAQEVTEVNSLKRQRRRFDTGVLKAQESERRRIGRELHDTLAQQLVALQLNLTNLGSQTGPKADALVAQCKEVVKVIQQEIRSFSFIAHPPELLIKGLSGALEGLAAGYASRTGLSIDLQISDVGETSASVEATVYRVAQEALSNIHRHAAARCASVQLVGTRRCIHLMISDDGIGFDASDDHNRTPMGVGIVGMKERVRELGGRCSIRRIANGTMVSASLPRRKREA